MAHLARHAQRCNGTRHQPPDPPHLRLALVARSPRRQDFSPRLLAPDYAVRSLAGIIDQVGLLRADQSTERNVQLAYRYYQSAETSHAELAFKQQFCHAAIEIEMIGVFDTVKALGIRLPFLWMWTEPQHEFAATNLAPS